MPDSATTSSLVYLDEFQVANAIGVSVSTVRKWRTSNRGPVYSKMEGSVRYRQSDIDAFFNANRVEPGVKGGE